MTMKPRLLIGFGAVLLLAMPCRVSAQRGAAGGFAASGAHFASVPNAGAPHAASVVRTSSEIPNSASAGSSAVRAHASAHAADVPSRHAGFSSASRAQGAAGRIFTPIGTPFAAPPGGRRTPPRVAPPGVVYLVGVGGYYYAAPADGAAGPLQEVAQEETQQEGQEADDQQAGAEEDRGRDRVVRRDESQIETNVAAPAPEQQDAEQQEPLPDVGTLILVLRDGSRLDVVAFTMTQGQVVYITPEGRRLTISAEIFDADATQRVNQERGTPMQLPL
jgi:hypothetical protein